jgi:C-terminal processing protease CtpA/Prc
MRKQTWSLLAVCLTAACRPAPTHKLSSDEKRADMGWVYSIFDQNYAPRDYKAERLRFDYKQLKDEYLKRALATQDNASFNDIVSEFAARFTDAHTQVMQAGSGLPGHERVAYLGFGGKRHGNRLLVSTLLPTVKEDSAFPIRVGDYVIALDGAALPDIVHKMQRLRDLGAEEANLTYHMERIFTRSSLSAGIPVDASARVSIERDGKPLEFVLPWVNEDVTTFLRRQRDAAQKDKTAMIEDVKASDVFQAGLDWLGGARVEIELPFNLGPGTRAWNHARFYDTAPTWESPQLLQAVRAHVAAQADPMEVKKPKTPEELEQLLRKTRTPRSDALFYVATSQNFVTYVGRVNTASGKGPTYAYVLIPSFSGMRVAEKQALAEFGSLIRTLKGLGVKGLVLDTIDNGGGSLTLTLKLAQMLSRRPLELPQISVKLSDKWIEEFEYEAAIGHSPAEQEIGRRVAAKLRAERDQGRTVSSPLAMESLVPFSLQSGNPDMPADMKVFVLVNEMCASACDVFASIVKDNHLGTIVGSRTMGAGGNVQLYIDSPNAHFVLTQTESLLLRGDGTPIENRGVEPDLVMDVNASIKDQYSAVRDRAIDSLCGTDCAPHGTRLAQLAQFDGPTPDSAPNVHSATGCSMAPSTDAVPPVLLGVAVALVGLYARRRRAYRNH